MSARCGRWLIALLFVLLVAATTTESQTAPPRSSEPVLRLPQIPYRYDNLVELPMRAFRSRPRAIVEIVTFIALLQILHRVQRYYPV